MPSPTVPAGAPPANTVVTTNTTLLTNVPAGTSITGTVSEVGASAAAGPRLFKVRIAVANPDGRLRPGMSATVAIPGQAAQAGAVTVPLSALLADAEGRRFRAFVIVAGQAQVRAVEVVDVIASAAVLGSGIAAGEQVVAVGAGLCVDGLRVDARAHDPDELYRRR